MPNNLSSVSISPTSTVFPNSLSVSLTETQTYPILVTGYHDGVVERSLIIDGVNPPRPAREWQVTKRFTATQLSTLRSFWKVTVRGGSKAFYYYPVFSQYDPTGVSSTGRVSVFFRGQWSETILLGRHDVGQLTLVEVL